MLDLRSSSSICYGEKIICGVLYIIYKYKYYTSAYIMYVCVYIYTETLIYTYICKRKTNYEYECEAKYFIINALIFSSGSC